ncbi:MAG: MBL fold metallo-hydrolase [Promethearchaeota archaeon]|nr:MAG: MBL fold metallo-hydrolase [Candidatus Lokiarchaeota archaeon]
MHPLLIAILIIIFGSITGFVIWILLTFHPIKTQEIPLKDEKLRIFAIHDGNVNSYIIRTSTSTIMIDTGIGEKTLNGIKSLINSPFKANHIFLTHSDYDHAGNIEVYPEVPLSVSSGEVLLITKKAARFGRKHFNKFGRVDYEIINKETPITVGDITILPVFTPGHTLGHTCYLVQDHYLFTGDTMRILPWGKQIPFLRIINMNHKQQLDSLRKLDDFIKTHNVKFLGTAHSGIQWL